MVRGTAKGLVRSGGVGLDAATRALLPVLTAAGADVTPTRRAAIDQFFRTGRTQGWLPLVKRFYLPIWGAAGPSAIDWIALGSGTFTGGAGMHQAGYVQGNGTSEWFSTGTNYTQASMTQTSAHLFAGRILNLTATPNVLIGARPDAASMMYLDVTGNAGQRAFRSFAYDPGAAVSSTAATNDVGLFLGSVVGTTHKVHRRAASGFATVTDSALAGNIPTTTVIQTMRRNFPAAPDQYDDGRHIGWSMGLGMTDTQASDYTAAFRTLWETCTGLTLP
jgi:hypothetical protein